MANFVLTCKEGGATFSVSATLKGGSPDFLGKYKPKINNFADVQKVVRAGMAKDVFDIGQELMTHYTYDGTVYDMPWVVLDNDRVCIWQDGSKHPGLWIMSKYITTEHVFFNTRNLEEATENIALSGLYYIGQNDSTYDDLDLNAGDEIPYEDYQHIYHCAVKIEKGYMYNRYLYSVIRQWLNSDATFGEWWTPQYIGNCPPDNLSTIKGFMAGLDDDFLAVINPVKIQVVTNAITDSGVTDIMYDRFFLQSIEEMYGEKDPFIKPDGIEGPYFPYWKMVTGLEYPDNGSMYAPNDGRKADVLGSVSFEDLVPLRSCPSNTDSDICVHEVRDGHLGSGNPQDAGCLPVCVIS